MRCFIDNPTAFLLVCYFSTHPSFSNSSYSSASASKPCWSFNNIYYLGKKRFSQLRSLTLHANSHQVCKKYRCMYCFQVYLPQETFSIPFFCELRMDLRTLPSKEKICKHSICPVI